MPFKAVRLQGQTSIEIDITLPLSLLWRSLGRALGEELRLAALQRVQLRTLPVDAVLQLPHLLLVVGLLLLQLLRLPGLGEVLSLCCVFTELDGTRCLSESTRIRPELHLVRR